MPVESKADLRRWRRPPWTPGATPKASAGRLPGATSATSPSGSRPPPRMPSLAPVLLPGNQIFINGSGATFNGLWVTSNGIWAIFHGTWAAFSGIWATSHGLWATFNVLRATLGYSGLSFWATWLSRCGQRQVRPEPVPLLQPGGMSRRAVPPACRSRASHGALPQQHHGIGGAAAREARWGAGAAGLLRRGVAGCGGCHGPMRTGGPR